MRDNTKPIIISTDRKPSLIGKAGNSQLYDQGFTFEQSGFTFEQAGIAFGGIYNFSSAIKPSISNATQISTSINIPSSHGGIPIGLLLALTYTN